MVLQQFLFAVLLEKVFIALNDQAELILSYGSN